MPARTITNQSPAEFWEKRHYFAPLICGLLALVTLLLYWPVVGYDFVTLDDVSYVSDNSHVQTGVTPASLAWAFTSGYAGNWHPLTWLSHMVDCEIYGLDYPGGHHLTSLLFHMANVILMFLVWRRFTGAIWRSAFVAALFAWHPLHVESVAWVSERKDVLSAFFFLLSLLAYGRYVPEIRDGSRSKTWYLGTLALFALGLMCKPMIVTLPFVLLLLDVWPLRRISNFGRLIVEKIPFFLIAGVSCLVTFFVQKKGGAMKSAATLTLADHLNNSLLGYLGYLEKTFWPVRLAVFYPYHETPSIPQVILAGCLIVALSCIALIFYRRRPYFFMGWFWFLGMLVPVIGLVQVGSQAMADRYAYLPLTGIFVATAWGFEWLTAARSFQKTLAATMAALALIGCLWLTHRQIGDWENSLALFNHALAVTGDNATVEDNLGLAIEASGNYDDAVKHFETSLKLDPGNGETWTILGKALSMGGKYEVALQCYTNALNCDADSAELRFAFANTLSDAGKPEAAAAQYQAALSLEPGMIQAQVSFGILLLRIGRLENAREQLTAAVNMQPRNAIAQDQLGHVLLKLNQPEQARPHFETAIAVQPDFADAQYQLGSILFQQGDLPGALVHLQTAAKLEPKNSHALFALGEVYNALRQYDPAADSFSAAFALDPKSADAPARLGSVEAKRGNYTAAIQAYHQALALNPNTVNALQGLAWILATSSHPELRNGTEALRLAREAVDLTHHQQPLALSALDAALAETGRFAEAIQAAQETAQVARNAHQNEIAALALARLEEYKSRIAYHDAASPSN